MTKFCMAKETIKRMKRNLYNGRSCQQSEEIECDRKNYKLVY